MNELLNKYGWMFREDAVIAVESGWQWLITRLLDCITEYVEYSDSPPFKISKIDTEQGIMCITHSNIDPVINGMFELTEHTSMYVCERCGSTVKVCFIEDHMSPDGYKILCDICKDKMDNR